MLDFSGTPRGIRTPDLQIRSLPLYPAELWARWEGLGCIRKTVKVFKFITSILERQVIFEGALDGRAEVIEQ